MSILDSSLALEALGGEGVELRARKRFPEALEGDLHDAGLLVQKLVENERPASIFIEERWSIVACFMGFNPGKPMTDRGFEPTRPPNGFEEDPVAFTNNAINLAIDLTLRPLHDVVTRVCANILLKTRGRENWRVKTETGGDWYYPAENDIARVRRMLEVVTTIPREEIQV